MGTYENRATRSYIIKVNDVLGVSRVLVNGRILEPCDTFEELKDKGEGWWYDKRQEKYHLKITSKMLKMELKFSS